VGCDQRPGGPDPQGYADERRGETVRAAELAFSPDGKRLAIDTGGTITILDASKSMKEIDQK
jgi:hypothetical protein